MLPKYLQYCLILKHMEDVQFSQKTQGKQSDEKHMYE